MYQFNLWLEHSANNCHCHVTGSVVRYCKMLQGVGAYVTRVGCYIVLLSTLTAHTRLPRLQSRCVTMKVQTLTSHSSTRTCSRARSQHAVLTVALLKSFTAQVHALSVIALFVRMKPCGPPQKRRLDLYATSESVRWSVGQRVIWRGELASACVRVCKGLVHVLHAMQ